MFTDNQSIHNTQMAEVMALLEDIVIDEALVMRINPEGATGVIYRGLIERLKYQYRWYGIRNEQELIDKWEELRSETKIPGTDFTDSSPSTEVNFITNVTQRLQLVTDADLWVPFSGMYRLIADTVNVYDSEATDPVENEDEVGFLYDAQISSTLNREDIVYYLQGNPWLVVCILISWLPHSAILYALGDIVDDNPE